MFNFKKIRSLLAICLLIAMLLSVLVSCDMFTRKTVIIRRPASTTTTKNDGTPGADPVVDPIDDNNRTLYQIYVRSFADSNGDGIGDIRGIIEAFDYLNDGDINSGEDLGVQAIWLTPVFEGTSPHKYDAINFYEIDYEFGDEEDLKDLIDLCNERNVKLILDLALNHTSPSHEWFQKSKEAHLNGNTSDPYYDYYCWSEYSKSNTSHYREFYFNAQNRGQNTDWWYEAFDGDGKMPELNYGNNIVNGKYSPNAVAKDMLEVAKYWMEFGVHGFRFDAIKHVYCDFNTNTNPDKRVPNHANSSAFYNWYTGELKKLYPEIYLIGECWDSESAMLQYYNAMSCFNFGVAHSESTLVKAAKGEGAMSTFTDAISNLQQKIKGINPNGMISNFLSNHDQDRSHIFLSSDNLKKMAASLYLLTPGTPVIYYGEEIGLVGSGNSVDDANRRLPMKWGGWGDNDKDYTCKVPNGASQIYQNMNFYTNGVASQQSNGDSLLSHYAKVLNIRHRYTAIARGTYKAIYSGNGNPTFGGFFVDYGDDDVIILHNTNATQTATYDLQKLNFLSGYSSFTILDYVGLNGAELNGTVLTLGPQTTVILK